MSFEFEQHDGGRRFSRRPKQKEDCTVRALVIATGADYDEAYDELRSRGRGSHRRFPFSIITKEVIFGHIFVWQQFEPNLNTTEFCEMYTCGTFILQMKGHVMCVKDGVVYDTGKVSESLAVSGAWRIEKARTARRKKPFKPYIHEE